VTLRSWLRRVGSALLGLAAIGAVIFVVNPASVARSITGFRLELIPAILALTILFYVLQGVRWHFLLADAGARLKVRETVVLNAAGQAITAIIPLGDLTRALFAAEASGCDFGTVAATVTVQELTYTLLLVIFALPTLLVFHLGVAAVVVTVAGIAGIVVILTVSPVFCAIHDVMARVPLLRRVLPAVDELQEEASELLHRPDALAWSVLDLARVAVAVTSFWLIVVGLAPGSISWWQAAFVLALSVIGGAVSLLPGGVGANEASVVGLLLVLGVSGGTGAAAAVIQRGITTGMSLALGFGAYAIARRRFRLGGLFSIIHRQPSIPAAA
jgi:glycosyltransferase 2 family protein